MTSSRRRAASSAARALLVGGERLLVIGIGLLEALRRGELVARRARGSGRHRIWLRVDLGAGRGELGLGLRDHRLLQAAGGVEIGERRLLAGDGRLRLGQRGPVVAVVELDQQVAGMDRLVVGDRHRRR